MIKNKMEIDFFVNERVMRFEFANNLPDFLDRLRSSMMIVTVKSLILVLSCRRCSVRLYRFHRLEKESAVVFTSK